MPLPAHLCFTACGAPVDALPRCPGVYRFYSERGALLYVGKSNDIHQRIMTHFSEGRAPGRQQRLVSAIARIDAEPCAGEIGALLRENAAIKAEAPMYNRRQRRLRKLWTIVLRRDGSGFLRAEASAFRQTDTREEDVFGLFQSPRQLDRRLRALARDRALCLRVLGLERGRGPCFQHQLRRCAGACAGREGPDEHNARLLAALGKECIAAWSFPGPLLLHEEGGAHPLQPPRQWHAIDQWVYLGSYGSRAEARERALARDRVEFDRDSYYIVRRALRTAAVAVEAVEASVPGLDVSA